MKTMSNRIQDLLKRAEQEKIAFNTQEDLNEWLRSHGCNEVPLFVPVSIDYPPTRSGTMMIHEFHIEHGNFIYRILVPTDIDIAQLRGEECGSRDWFDAAHLAWCKECDALYRETSLKIAHIIAEAFMYAANRADERVRANGARTLPPVSDNFEDVLLPDNKGVLRIQV